MITPWPIKRIYCNLVGVCHDGLIFKLHRCGSSGPLLSLVESFLADRKQRTVLNVEASQWGNVTAGVPQGSILSKY